MPYPHRRRVALLAVGMLLFLSACVAPYTPNPDNTITLLSPNSIILSAQGQQATIHAEIRRPDGTLDERAALTLTSSDPDSVTVTPDGTVTAQADLGSATITLTSETLTPVTVTVIVAQSLDWTHFLDDDNIVSASADQSEIILARTPSTRDLEVGDVIVSGEDGGVFARILAIERQGDTMVIEGRLALLSEVFEELDLDLRGASEPVTVAVENGVATVRSESGRLLQQRLLDDIECEAGSGLANVSFTGFTFEATLDRLDPTVRYRERLNLDAVSDPQACILFPEACTEVEVFTLAVDAEASMEAGFGQLKLAGALEASVECKLELPPKPILPVPLLGPLVLAGTVTPSVTVTVTGSYNGASLTLQGPKFERSVALEAGFDYSADTGFRTVGDGGPTFGGPGLSWVDASGKIDSELSLSIGPALNLTVGLAVFVGGEEVLPFNLATASLKGAAEVTLDVPIDPLALDYKGPRWALKIGASADLNALLDSLSATEGLLKFVGLGEQASDLFSLDLTLFEVETTVLSGPKPDVSAERQGVSRTVALSTSDDALDDGAGVRFLAAEALAGGGHGPLEEVASATVQGGTATSTWEVPGDGAQRYKVTARVDSIFGDALPYGPEQSADLELGGGIVLDPESLTVTLGIGETRDETVALVSEGLAADYEITNTQLHVTIANPQGSIEVDGTVELDLNVTCPDEIGSYPQTFELAFTDGDGGAIEEGVPDELVIDLSCTGGLPGFTFVRQVYSAGVSLNLQGPRTANGEAFISEDALGTGQHNVTDVVSGVDNSTSTEIGPLGFAETAVSGSAFQSCESFPERTTTGSASGEFSSVVSGSSVTLSGDLNAALAYTVAGCGGGTDGAVAGTSIQFDLGTTARLTGTWSCDEGFRPPGHSTRILLTNTTLQVQILSGLTEPCDIDRDIPPGRYALTASPLLAAKIGLEGSYSTSGSYTFTITLPD